MYMHFKKKKYLVKMSIGIVFNTKYKASLFFIILKGTSISKQQCLILLNIVNYFSNTFQIRKGDCCMDCFDFSLIYFGILKFLRHPKGGFILNHSLITIGLVNICHRYNRVLFSVINTISHF